MSAYLRDRVFMIAQFSPNMRNNANEHTFGGDNGPIGSDLTQQGTSFPGNCRLTSGQIVGFTSRAGSGPPGGELCVFTTENDDNSKIAFQAGWVTIPTNWKRHIDATPGATGNGDILGEDYDATPDELFGRRDHYGDSVNNNITVTVHGKYTGS